MQCRLLSRSSDSPVEPCSCRRGHNFPSTYLLVSYPAPLFSVCPGLSLALFGNFIVCPEMCISPDGVPAHKCRKSTIVQRTQPGIPMFCTLLGVCSGYVYMPCMAYTRLSQVPDYAKLL